MYSPGVCAPAPTAPSPSSVGTPSAAVRLPSDPPPLSDPSTANPISPASAWAFLKSPAEMRFSIGGRCSPPLTSIFAPSKMGRSARIFLTSRCISARRTARASITACALAGITLDRTPPEITSAFTVTPRRASLNFTIRAICSAISCTALTPSCGFTPACAARPVALTSNPPMALRCVFSFPVAPVPGSSTNTALLRPASFSINFCDDSLPVSSSEVHRKTNRLRASACAARSASTANSAITRPPFMSSVPGPYARPPAIRNGDFASDPRSYTVSVCPSTRICPAGLPCPSHNSARR